MTAVQIAAISIPGRMSRELNCAPLTFGYGLACLENNQTMLVNSYTTDENFKDNIAKLCKRFGKEWYILMPDFLDNYTRMARWPIVETGKAIQLEIKRKEHER